MATSRTCPVSVPMKIPGVDFGKTRETIGRRGFAAITRLILWFSFCTDKAHFVASIGTDSEPRRPVFRGSWFSFWTTEIVLLDVFCATFFPFATDAVMKLRYGHPVRDTSIDSCQSRRHQVNPIHAAVRGGCPLRVSSANAHSSRSRLAPISVFFDAQPTRDMTSNPGQNRPLFLPVYWPARSIARARPRKERRCHSADVITAFGIAMNE